MKLQTRRILFDVMFAISKKLNLVFFKTMGGGVALALFTMLLFVGNIRAQTDCPTSLLPTGCSWGNSNSSRDVPIPGTTCIVQIHYCYVCCNGQNYLYISNMYPLSSACEDVDPQLYENAAATSIFNTIADLGCNPCPNGSTVVTVAFPTCWVKGGVSGAWTFSGCGTTTCYCLLSATVTCTDGVATLSGCTSTTVGTCSTCITDPGGANLWVSGICYSLTCPPPPCP
jgi:hypothetical protein